MKVIEIEQKDIQRKGGLYARQPSSFIIYFLMKEAARRLGKNKLRIVDLTFGEGRFHIVPQKHGLEEFLVGVDVEVRNWLVTPDAFIPKPLQKETTKKLLQLLGPFDVLIIDPPFHEHLVRGRERRKHYYAAFGRPRFLLEEGYRIAARLGVPYVISHFNQRQFLTSGYTHIIEIRFRPFLGVKTSFTSYFWLSEKKEGEKE